MSLRESITGYYHRVARLTANLAVSDAEGYRSLARSVRGATGQRQSFRDALTESVIDRLVVLFPDSIDGWNQLRFVRSRLEGLVVPFQDVIARTESLIAELATLLSR